MSGDERRCAYSYATERERDRNHESPELPDDADDPFEYVTHLSAAGVSERAGTDDSIRSTTETDDGRIACSRPAAVGDFCRWHTPREERDRSLTPADVSPGDRLPGAIAEGLSFNGEWSFTDCTLIGASFTAARLDGVAFRDATATEAVFRDASLRGVDCRGLDAERAAFDGAALDRVTADGANVARASFADARIGNTDLVGANLTESQFADAAIVASDLSETRLEHADLRDARVWSVDCTDATLTGIDCTGADLSGVDCTCVTAPDAAFTDADLLRVDFTDAVLVGADFTDAMVSGVDFTDADLTDATFTDADLSDTTLADADLSDTSLANADLSGANLSGCDLSGRDLSGVELTDATLTNADLTDTDLSNATLDGADCTGADFTDADLTAADCVRTDFTDARFHGTTIDGTNCYRAELSGVGIDTHTTVTYDRAFDTDHEPGVVRWHHRAVQNLFLREHHTHRIRNGSHDVRAMRARRQEAWRAVFDADDSPERLAVAVQSSERLAAVWRWYGIAVQTLVVRQASRVSRQLGFAAALTLVFAVGYVGAFLNRGDGAVAAVARAVAFSGARLLEGAFGVFLILLRPFTQLSPLASAANEVETTLGIQETAVSVPAWVAGLEQLLGAVVLGLTALYLVRVVNLGRNAGREGPPYGGLVTWLLGK